jgi:Type I phosphodiesterase / nucleotide pyrophosphatase
MILVKSYAHYLTVGLMAGASAVLTLGCGALAGESPSAAGKGDRPKLAVLLVFDQMRADYLTRWQKYFGEGGFKRLQDEGAWFQNCNYPYAYTVTAAGHASLVTGSSPYRHGIVGNDWYDRTAARVVASTESERASPVPPVQKASGGAPMRRRQPTVGDALLDATTGKAKVAGLSIKDRAAILLAALRAQICYWFNTYTGTFGTSTHYRDRVHPWVEEFNRRHTADQWFGKEWARLRPDLDYALLSGPDAVAAEGEGYKQGQIFPHPTTSVSGKPDKNYYGAVANCPFGNDMLLALARRAIEAEGLGQGEVPDLLLISFSSNDMVGHVWGPDSQEVLDMTLRSDLIVKELLDFLDARVGRGRYHVVLSADHGVCPLPEVSQAQGKDAGRVSPRDLRFAASHFLDETYGKKGEKAVWIEEAVDCWFYLHQGAIRAAGLRSADVEAALAKWLARQPGIQAAYTRAQLTAGPLANDPVGESVRRSFDPERSGDVYFLVKPYYLLSPPVSPGLFYRTTHGTPHPYDTHVPLLVFGPGIHPGVRTDPVAPQAAAAILARALGVPPPSGAEYWVPDGLWK